MNKMLADLLGLSDGVKSLFDIATVIQNGLPAGVIDRVEAALDMNDKEMSAALGVSAKTISRSRAQLDKKLTVTVGDRVYRLAHVFTRATDVFGDEESAREWLRAPQIGLNNKTPLELINTEAGAREVEDLLGRIEHGVIS